MRLAAIIRIRSRCTSNSPHSIQADIEPGTHAW